MLGRRVNPLLTADDMSDLHQVIVDHIGQMVGGQSIRFKQDLRIHHAPVELDDAA